MSARRIAVAVSGGRDSTALWHATARAAAAMSPTPEVIGLHVHHGLHERADAWLAHLQRQARRWAGKGLPVSLDWRKVQGRPARGDSIEAWARHERYAALGDMARAAGIDTVLLGHHQQDQAETFLLQALRGAGPAGLAAMPERAVRDGIEWLRPWLAQPVRAIEHYVRRHRLGHIEDPSNHDLTFARSRLRTKVLPLFIEHFEQAVPSLCASAARAQEAQQCQLELARIDLATLCPDGGEFRVDPWLALSPARRGNALRHWLSDALPQGVPHTLLRRLQIELTQAQVARWPVAGAELRLYDARLSLAAIDEAVNEPPATLCVDLSRPGKHPVPEWGGAFEVSAVDRHGLAPHRLAECGLRARAGGEDFQRTVASLPRSLKKQYQAARVPQWSRTGPLVFTSTDLLFVPALGIDARRHAPAGQPALQLRWVPGASVPDGAAGARR
ncbi:MAG: tRNA lysidine(34) synthetase TilS [Rubrivivax sp.]